MVGEDEHELGIELRRLSVGEIAARFITVAWHRNFVHVRAVAPQPKGPPARKARLETAP